MIFAGAAMVAVLFLVALFAASETTLVTCGGDGGSPYAAPASPQGKYCDTALPAVSIGVGLVLAIIGSILAAMRGRWWPLVASGVTAAALILSPPVLGELLSDKCADEPSSMTAKQFDRYFERRPECGHY